MIRDFEQLKGMLREKDERSRVAVVCSHDEHTMEAVMHSSVDGMIEPVLLGDADKTREIARQIGWDIADVTVVDVKDPAVASQMAADMARGGEVQAIMKGKLETAQLMRILINKEHGIRTSDTMSILGLFDSPHYHKVFGMTDIGLLTYPNAEQKISATKNAVAAFHALGVECPKVGVLAAIEKVNPKMPETIDAQTVKDAGIEGCVVEGPISMDLAMNPEAAGIKGYESPVAGDADILVVPDIASGNIAAKSITNVGGGRCCGLVLVALVPIILVSRSATADDKYMSLVLSALIGGAK